MAVERKKLKRRHKAKPAPKPKTEQISEKTSLFSKLKITIMSTVLCGILLFVLIFMTLQNAIIGSSYQRVKKEAVVGIFSQLNFVNKQVKEIEENIDRFIFSSEMGIIEPGTNNYMSKEIRDINSIIFVKNKTLAEDDKYRVNTDYKVKSILIYKKKTSELELVGVSDERTWKEMDRSNKRTIHSIDELKSKGAIVSFPISDYYIVYILDITNNKLLDNILNNSTMLQMAMFMLFLSIFFAYFFARSISTPLVKMEQTVSQIAQGDLSGRLEYTTYDEINQLVQSYNMMADTLQKLYSTLEKQVQDRTVELKSAYAELQSTQAMMVHSEKMKSLGELVAGIMHEINNPINFIYGNMTHLTNYSNDLIQIIDEYAKYNDSLKPEEKQDIEKLKEEVDYEFLKTDLPDLIKSCKEGADRAKNIIQDLKSFSRMEEVAITDIDIPKEIDTVLNILHNKIKNKAEVHKEYIDSVPMIEAFGGQLNQVFMNILDNAVGAIPEHGDIWIRINKDSTQKNLVIEIEDNGVGMDAETMNKVFNPFFTTKPVGQGTGLGMSITYKIIKNHQGDIRVESTQNVGTKFIVTLPITIDRELIGAATENGDANNG